MNIKYKIINTPFKDTFTISKGSKTHQPAFLVELEFMGVKGYGEAPAISYYNISTDRMKEDLEEKMAFFPRASYNEPERFWHYVHHIFENNTFLVDALDMAGWDLYGRMQGKPLRKIWNIPEDKAAITDYTIGIDTIEKMVEKMKAKPWPVYKIKLGTNHDIEIIEALRKEVDVPFRIDANAAWKMDEALEKIPALKDLGVELIEQPLAKDDWDGMKVLFEKSPLPLFADESCVKEEDVVKCKNYFHGINIKLTKCGGITPALRMIDNARGLDMKLMLGSMNESSIGTSAMAQMAPLFDYIDIDGPLLLNEENPGGAFFDNGKIINSDLPGIGIDVLPFE